MATCKSLLILMRGYLFTSLKYFIKKRLRYISIIKMRHYFVNINLAVLLKVPVVDEDEI